MADQSTDQAHWSSDHWSKSTRLLSIVRNRLVLVWSWSTILLVPVYSPVYHTPGPGRVPGRTQPGPGFAVVSQTLVLVKLWSLTFWSWSMLWSATALSWVRFGLRP